MNATKFQKVNSKRFKKLMAITASTDEFLLMVKTKLMAKVKTQRTSSKMVIGLVDRSITDICWDAVPCILQNHLETVQVLFANHLRYIWQVKHLYVKSVINNVILFKFQQNLNYATFRSPSHNHINIVTTRITTFTVYYCYCNWLFMID